MTTYYWTNDKKTLIYRNGREKTKVKFGGKLPGGIDKERIEQLIASGDISSKKPETITDATINRLKALEKSNAELIAKNGELVKENEALNEKIIELELELEKSTDPDTGGGD